MEAARILELLTELLVSESIKNSGVASGEIYNDSVMLEEVINSTSDEIKQAFESISASILRSCELSYLLKHENQVVIFSKLESFNLEKFKEIEALGAKKLFLSFDIWSDIVADTSFSEIFSSSDNTGEAGHLGKLNNIDLFTDGFRIKEAKVLQPRTLYWFK